MSRILSMLLCMAILFAFAGCGANGDHGSTPAESMESDAADASASINVDSMKQTLLEKYGGEFELYRSLGLNNMELIKFVFDETSVVRQHLDSMKDDVPTHSGTWEIVDGELVITGEWNETFILDLENNTATSKADGEVYRIPEKDDSLTRYGVLQDAVLTYGFPITLRMSNGTESTTLTLYEDRAVREWEANSQNETEDNLSWSVDGSCLTITGDWEGIFTIDVGTGIATSQTDATVYDIFVIKDGAEAALVE